MSDAERDARLSAWMAAAQGGDAAAYTTLLRECLPLVARMARREGVRGEAAEDVVQDTLLAIHRARATYDPARPFLPWLAAIAQRRAIDQLRRSGRRQGREVHDPLAYEGAPDPGDGADAALGRSERAERVRAWVDDLPPRQREAVDRLALAEESLEEASRSTGRTKVALKVNLHRALKALRAKLTTGGEDA